MKFKSRHYYKLNFGGLLSAHVSQDEVEERNEITTRKNVTGIKKKTLKNRWRVKSKKRKKKKQVVLRMLFRFIPLTNLCEKDLSFRRSHSRLADKIIIEEFNGINAGQNHQFASPERDAIFL